MESLDSIFLSISLCCLLHQANPLDGISCSHTADIYKSLLVSQHWWSMCRNRLANAAKECIPTLPGVPSIYWSSYLDGLWDAAKECLLTLPGVPSISWSPYLDGFLRWIENDHLAAVRFFFQDLLKNVEFLCNTLLAYSLNISLESWRLEEFLLYFIVEISIWLRVCAFPMHMVTSLSVDEILLLKYVNWSTK